MGNFFYSKEEEKEEIENSLYSLVEGLIEMNKVVIEISKEKKIGYKGDEHKIRDSTKLVTSIK